jgi:hypothetical protein
MASLSPYQPVPSRSEPPPRRDAKPHSPWRRSACDRCRGQKLCCTRKADDPTGSCNRCARMHLVCNTGSPKALGRPPRKTSQLEKDNLNNETTGTDDHVEPSPIDHRRARNILTTPSSASPPLYLSWPFPHNDGQPVEVNEDAPMPFPSDGTNLVSMLDFDTDSNDHHSSSSSHQPQLSQDHLLPSLPPLDLSSEMAFDFFWSPGGQNMLVYPPSIDTQSEGTSHTDGTETDPGVLLATLQQSLAKQAVFLRISNWDSSDLSITAGTGTDASSDGSFHPLASILKSTTQLLTILRRFKSRPEGLPESPPSPPPIVHVVTIITCYLLVISIFDTIFRQILMNPVDLNQRLENSSASSSTSSSAATSSTYQGASQRERELLFVPLTPRLRLRLLVQVVEHQLELLERALGLPHADCVSTGLREDAGSRTEEDGGILNWRETRVLFRAIIEADDPGLRGGDGAIKQAAASLRENLKVAQRATGKGVV